MYSFEDKKDVVDNEIRKRRNKWFLDSLSYIDYDDVSQIIRAHIHKKWYLWRQDEPLEPWIHRIISNQIKNLVRNHYGSFAKPCINCPFNESLDAEGNECGFTKSSTQCNECPLFAKWSRSKKNAYDIKLAKSFDAHDFEVSDSSGPSYDMEAAASRLHKKMEKYLTPRQYEAYQWIVVEGLDDSEVAKRLGLKSSEAGREAGYRQIRNLKKIFKDFASEIVKKEEVFFD